MAEFEHALFMLLLLVGILSARLPHRWLALALTGLGIILSLIPPYILIPIPWNVVLALVVPLLFWQNARFWLQARWTAGWLDLLLWITTALALAAVLIIPRYLAWSGAVLFGVVTASLLWQALDLPDVRRGIGLVGPLTLVFLLTEIDVAIESPSRYVGGLASGAFVGLITALPAIWLSRPLLPRARGWVALFQAYVAYALGLAIGASGVMAALVSVAVFSELSLRQGLVHHGGELPAPLYSYPVFLTILALFIFLGWQAHQPISLALAAEAAAGFVVGMLLAWAGNRAGLPGFRTLDNALQAAARVGLFILAALLLWPRRTLVEPFALGAALALAFLSLAVSASLMSAADTLRDSEG